MGVYMGDQYIYATCPICREQREFRAPDDWYSCRDQLRSSNCLYGFCVTRERAVAATLFSIYDREIVKQLSIYECSPVMRGLSLWLEKHCAKYCPTAFFPDRPFGAMVNRLRNENLEALTIPDESVDVWIHLDVLEHLFKPFQAMREIYRTLKKSGVCIFTAPTYPERVKSEQVAWLLPDGSTKVQGTPEYHGNPQHPEKGSLVTWRYGYDLPLLLNRETGFDVEVRRWQAPSLAIMGPMTEVYICRKITA
jgi:SAM-dependent methyltransferase